ncbi:hypothetical protein [Polycladidibacter stylochi]|uniref:hypothetical protein n=1 Tax=Polycladidibacter stylochi TaxID=1807766 RepID=UPI00082CB803|nr:hypothetical protein [Pseudovibrio stylochi]
MGTLVHVKVAWEPCKQEPPISGKYITPAHFLNPDDKWPDEAWSVVLEFHKQEGAFNYHRGTARFLVQNAPSDWLKSGSIFEMFEGKKKTAKVTVL